MAPATTFPPFTMICCHIGRSLTGGIQHKAEWSGRSHQLCNKKNLNEYLLILFVNFVSSFLLHLMYCYLSFYSIRVIIDCLEHIDAKCMLPASDKRKLTYWLFFSYTLLSWVNCMYLTWGGGGALPLESGTGMCHSHDPLSSGQPALPSLSIFHQCAVHVPPF